MRRRAGSFAAALLVLASATPGAALGRQSGASVELDRSSISLAVGQQFSFASTIRNPGSAPLTGVVVHLNVLSLDPSVYVDPEDWSSHRTRYLDPIAPSGSTTVHWSLRAVNRGRFVIYVGALPAGGAAGVAVSRPLHVDVAGRRTLNPGGVIPLVVAIPAVLLLAACARRLAAGRRSRGPRRQAAAP
jgi:hypothetical protein